MDLFTELHCFPLYPPAAEAAQLAPPLLGSGHGHQSHGPLQHGHAHQQRARANQHHQHKRPADGATTGRVRSPDGREHLHHQHRLLSHHRHQRRLHLRQQDQRVKTETVFFFLGGGGHGKRPPDSEVGTLNLFRLWKEFTDKPGEFNMALICDDCFGICVYTCTHVYSLPSIAVM